MSIATYFLPTFASLAALNNWQDWGAGYFSEAARLLGGGTLAAAVTIAAAVANICLLNSTVLATTRMPFAMAEDGFLPQQLTRLHPRFGTPAVCIVISAIVYALLAIHSLAQLITIYAWLRVATTLMTALSAWRLRKTHATLDRAFKIPGGNVGLLYAVAAPVFMGIVATVGSLLSADKFALHWGPAAILLGPVAYLVLRKKPQCAATNGNVS
jgi:amino acid transporter